MQKPKPMTNGRYRAEVSYRGKRHSFGIHDTYRKAEKAQIAGLAGLAKQETEVPVVAARGTTTLNDYAEIYLASRKADGIAPGTYENYRGDLKNHILPKFGHRQLADIRPSEVAAWWNELGEKPSRKSVYRVLSNLYRWPSKTGR